ncbi:MAG: hypothetical protein V1889_03215 [archaeon]
MKSLFFILFFIFVGLACAGSVSPGIVNYDVSQGGEVCHSIHVDLGSVDVFDLWAKNTSVDWNIVLFNVNSSEYGLIVDYPKVLNSEGDIEICISGEELGEYRGAIVFRQGKQGSSIIQYAVWLNVSISEKVEEKVAPIVESPLGSSSSGSGSGGGALLEVFDNSSQVVENNSVGGMIVEVVDEVEDFESAGVTGAVVGGRGNWKVAVGVLVLVGVGLVLVYSRRKKYA